MAWDSYDIDPEGAYVFKDAQAGTTFRAAPLPSVQDFAKNLPRAGAAPLEPLTPAPLPDPITVVQGAPQTMQLAKRDADERAPAPAPPKPPAPPPAAPEAPQNFTPAEVSSQGPQMSMPEPAPTAAAGGSKGPGNIVYTPGMNTGAMTPEQLAGYLHWQASQAALRGSPGVFTPGGTFPTGKTVQYAPGPHPLNTAEREAAEQDVGKVQSDLAYVQSRAAEEQALHAQEQQRQAAERVARLEDIHKRESAKLDEIFGQVEQTQKELASANVDPDRLVNSMSTGRQIGAAIAMGLGALGQALAGDKAPPMAMNVFNDAIAKDIEAQKYAIEKKRADLNSLGQTYRLALDKFGNERMAADAAWLAGSEIVKAKIQKTIAEADAAQGMETQWADGKIVAGAPYSMKAKLLLAQLEAEQAAKREALSQAMRGQVAQQYVTTQDKVTGGTAPNYAKAAEEADKAAKSLGGDEQQQVMFGGQRYKLGKFAESGEGKQMRADMVQIENLEGETQKLERILKENPISKELFDSAEFKGVMERLSSGGNVILGQGAKNNDEAKRWESILGSAMRGAPNAVKDMRAWLHDLGQRRLDQLNAKPMGPAGGITPPQRLQDIATGAAKPGGGGVVGLPRAAPPGVAPAIVRSSGAKASPLDRATAAAVQAKTGTGKGAEAAARAALRQARDARELDPSEFRRASELVDAGQYDELMSYLGRVRGTISQAGMAQPPAAQVNPAVSMMMARLAREATEGLDSPASVQSVTVTTKGKGKGGAPAVKTPKLTDLSSKKKGR